MSEPGHPTRTTVLVAVALAVLLLVAYAVTSGRERPASSPTTAPSPGPTAGATAAPSPDPSLPQLPDPTPPAGMPRPGRDTPVRSLGSLTGRSVLASGHGTVDLRYARAAHNATRVHFICTGCDDRTWLVELPRGYPVARYGPLADPNDATGVTDTVDLHDRTDLLVRAPARAAWAVTLTPFDEIPVHRETFTALDDDVVAVRAVGALTLTCGGEHSYRTFAREAGSAEYDAHELGGADRAGTATLTPGAGTDLLVLDVRCHGRWTVTVP